MCRIHAGMMGSKFFLFERSVMFGFTMASSIVVHFVRSNSVGTVPSSLIFSAYLSTQLHAYLIHCLSK
jgi:hypothetical protein